MLKKVAEDNTTGETEIDLIKWKEESFDVGEMCIETEEFDGIYKKNTEEELDGDFESNYNAEDAEYVKKAQSGDVSALNFIIDKYRPLVMARSSSYFIKGSDREDTIQEGMIGLYKAIRDYNDDKVCSFSNFANMCVTRHIITAVKTSSRQKHIPLNSYVSLNKPVYENENDSERTLSEIMDSGDRENPENLVISRENYKMIEEKISEVLTPLEEEVMVLYISGKKYSEIAKILNKKTKAIDNAVQRAKKKLEKEITRL